MASSSDRRSSSSDSRPRARRGDGAPDLGSLGDSQQRYDFGGFDVESFSDDLKRPAARRRAHKRVDPRKQRYYRRVRLLVGSVVGVTSAIVIYLVLMYSPLFEVRTIAATPTEHITSSTISTLAAVPEGSTLLNVDEQGIANRLAANPWVGSVDVRRVFPNELVIEVTERACAAIVMLSNGTDAWRLSEDGHWLESVAMQEATADNGVASPLEQAAEAARREGVVFVSGVAATVQPQGGTACEDAAITGVLTYLAEFGDELAGQIVSATAPSRDAIAVTLENGIEVSLGAPVNIPEKEAVVLGMLEQYAGQITYINVRVPTKPVYRGVDATVAADAEQAAQDPGLADQPAQADEAPGETTEGQEDGGQAGEEQAGEEQQAEEEAAPQQDGAYIGTDDGGPGGNLDEGGYYSDSGVWIYAYHDANGNWINGYYEEDGTWVQIS